MNEWPEEIHAKEGTCVRCARPTRVRGAYVGDRYVDDLCRPCWARLDAETPFGRLMAALVAAAPKEEGDAP